jgi:hypothetical protein
MMLGDDFGDLLQDQWPQDSKALVNGHLSQLRRYSDLKASDKSSNVGSRLAMPGLELFLYAAAF